MYYSLSEKIFYISNDPNWKPPADCIPYNPEIVKDEPKKDENKKPKFDRKTYMREYQRKYMKRYFKDKMINCECGAIVYPYGIKRHRETLKHKYLLTILSSNTLQN
jgi:hypothetical protein